MGKARLEDLKKTNERAPGWYDIKESDDKCPICGSALFSASSQLLVMDGNTIFHCENEDDHTFWRNARDMNDVLYLNERASETSFEYEVKYKKDAVGAWEIEKIKTYTLQEIKEAIKASPKFSVNSQTSDRKLETIEVDEFLFNVERISRKK